MMQVLDIDETLSWTIAFWVEREVAGREYLCFERGDKHAMRACRSPIYRGDSLIILQ